MNPKMSKKIAAHLAIVIMIALLGSACVLTAAPQPTITQGIGKEAMLLKVQQYARDHYLASTSGTYQHLNDQVHYFAKAGYYKTTETGMVLKDFVFESDLAWENTTTTIDKPHAGCGFAFHSDGNNTYIIAVVGLDGYVYLVSAQNGRYIDLGKSPYGKVEVAKGNAHIGLVVSGIHYTFFVNGKMIVQGTAEPDGLETGQFDYLVDSGSDVGVGTTCKFTNIDLWTVNQSS